MVFFYCYDKDVSLLENNENGLVENTTKKKNNKSKVLLIVSVLLLVIVSLGIGLFLGKNMTKENKKVEKENKQEETEKKENNIIDFEEAPNPTIIKMDYDDYGTTTVKPDDYGDTYYYKDGYVGYEADQSSYDVDDSSILPDTEEVEFIKLYECKNKEFGKCGYAEARGVDSSYNLEEGLKIAQEGLLVLDKQYIFVYDSNVYQKNPYAYYFTKESPLIIYDIINKKEVGRYAAVYATYSSKAQELIAVSLDDKYGIIKIDNGNVEELLPFEYDYIGNYDNKYMLVKEGQYYVYDLNTKEQIGPFNNQISSFSDDFIVTNEGSYEGQSEKNYRLYSKKGDKLLVNAGNQYIIAQKDYAIVVDPENKLNIYNKDGKAILSQSIALIKDGTFHIRCCASMMKFEYTDNYVIDLKTGSIRKN